MLRGRLGPRLTCVGGLDDVHLDASSVQQRLHRRSGHGHGALAASAMRIHHKQNSLAAVRLGRAARRQQPDLAQQLASGAFIGQLKSSRHVPPHADLVRRGFPPCAGLLAQQHQVHSARVCRAQLAANNFLPAPRALGMQQAREATACPVSQCLGR